MLDSIFQLIGAHLADRLDYILSWSSILIFHRFSPALETIYRECKKENLDFEIIFISFDKSEREMMAYMNEVPMSWYAIPFNDPRREELSQHFGVYSLPTLLILDRHGNTVTTNGRMHIQMNGKKAIENYIQGIQFVLFVWIFFE